MEVVGRLVGMACESIRAFAAQDSLVWADAVEPSQWTVSALAFAKQLRLSKSQAADSRSIMIWRGSHQGGVRGYGHATQKAYHASCPMLTTGLNPSCTNEQRNGIAQLNQAAHSMLSFIMCCRMRAPRLHLLSR